MKKISIIGAFLICLNLFTSCGVYSTVTFNDEPITMVFENYNCSKNQLFVKANDWMIKIFTKANSVIEFSDKEEGVIIGKYLLYGQETIGLYGIKTDYRVWAKIDIRVKDDKARISILPMGKWNYNSSGLTVYNYSKEQAIEDIKAIMKDFNEAMKADKIEF